MTDICFSKITIANKYVESKHAFEQYAATFGVKIQKYHAYNGSSNTHFFKESTIVANQTISFSGVEAHHHNRISEHMINTVVYCAWSILINEMICCTYVITTKLWPYAIKLAIGVVNNCTD